MYCFSLIIIGSDSKILQNCGKLKLKNTQVEMLLNKTVLVVRERKKLFASTIILKWTWMAWIVAFLNALIAQSLVDLLSCIFTSSLCINPCLYECFLWICLKMSPIYSNSLFIMFQILLFMITTALLLAVGGGLFEYRVPLSKSGSVIRLLPTWASSPFGAISFYLVLLNHLLFHQCFIAGHNYCLFIFLSLFSAFCIL